MTRWSSVEVRWVDCRKKVQKTQQMSRNSSRRTLQCWYNVPAIFAKVICKTFHNNSLLDKWFGPGACYVFKWFARSQLHMNCSTLDSFKTVKMTAVQLSQVNKHLSGKLFHVFKKKIKSVSVNMRWWQHAPIKSFLIKMLLKLEFEWSWALGCSVIWISIGNIHF